MKCRFCNAECGAESQHYCALGERSHPRMLERITALEDRCARLEAQLGLRDTVHNAVENLEIHGSALGDLNPETA